VTVAFDEAVIKHIDSELRTIKSQYRGAVPEEFIDMAAAESLQLLAESRVPQFVPLFVGRFTRERIRGMLSATTEAKTQH
jgi:hypothetical protein